MKVLNEEQGRELKQAIGSQRRGRRRHRPRALRPDELIWVPSPHRRRLLENQGTRALRDGRRFPPGVRVSVQLANCGHRTRVEALTCGRAPDRARCPRCVRWQRVVPGSERPPRSRSGGQRVVAERVEVRDGQTFRVVEFAPARRKGSR